MMPKTDIGILLLLTVAAVLAFFAISYKINRHRGLLVHVLLTEVMIFMGILLVSIKYLWLDNPETEVINIYTVLVYFVLLVAFAFFTWIEVVAIRHDIESIFRVQSGRKNPGWGGRL